MVFRRISKHLQLPKRFSITEISYCNEFTVVVNSRSKVNEHWRQTQLHEKNQLQAG